MSSAQTYALVNGVMTRLHVVAARKTRLSCPRKMADPFAAEVTDAKRKDSKRRDGGEQRWTKGVPSYAVGKE